jgi:aminoglycoside phosphotransferase (APT) family kinase protein
MPELEFVSRIAQTLYDLEVQVIESLDQHPSDWRGIYRVQDAQANLWVLRLMRLPDGFEALMHIAQLLEKLTQQHFPAPTVRATVNQKLIGTVANWATVVLTYVDGDVLGRQPTDLGQLACLLGELHTLSIDDRSPITKSRCHPDCISTAIHQLATHGANVPREYRLLVTDLHLSMATLQQREQKDLCITHGDCWYMIAIKTRDDRVILIDWDLAGSGLPFLELGNLLITSHFDLSQPLHLRADNSIVKEIMRGYQQRRGLLREDREKLVYAMRFLLAYQLGSYVADAALVVHPEFPFVLQKLQARYEVTQEIADIAADYIE